MLRDCNYQFVPWPANPKGAKGKDGSLLLLFPWLFFQFLHSPHTLTTWGNLCLICPGSTVIKCNTLHRGAKLQYFWHLLLINIAANVTSDHNPNSWSGLEQHRQKTNSYDAEAGCLLCVHSHKKNLQEIISLYIVNFVSYGTEQMHQFES